MHTVSNTKVTVNELKEMSSRMMYNIVKAVVDVEKKIMVVDADLHADQEQQLLESGSKQHDLWGINLHPDKFGTDEFIEFDSMINLRPTQANLSRGVDDPTIQKHIRDVVEGLVAHE